MSYWDKSGYVFPKAAESKEQSNNALKSWKEEAMIEAAKAIASKIKEATEAGKTKTTFLCRDFVEDVIKELVSLGYTVDIEVQFENYRDPTGKLTTRFGIANLHISW